MLKNTPNFCRATILLALLGGSAAHGQIAFEDVSAETGMEGYTETWGGSWGDINGDNWPDLFNQGHREYPRMFRNTGEGNFQDIAFEVDPGNWIAFPFDDKHGATWADFDNDGDDDLLISVSATGDAQYLVNTDGQGNFVDRAADAEVLEDKAARLGVFFDFNHDGLLDLAQGNTKNSFLRQRDPTDPIFPDVKYVEVGWAAGWWCDGKLNYLQLIDLDGTLPLEILCMQEGVFPVAAYDYTEFPFDNVTGTLPAVSHVNDTAVADLDNDLLSDMVMTRGAIRPSGATLVNSNRIEAWLRKDDEAPPGKGIHFESPGAITVTVDHKGMGIYSAPDVFELDPVTNPSAILYTIEESPEGSMTFDWNPAESRWEIAIIEVEKSFQAYLRIDTVEPATNLTEVALDVPEGPFPTLHLVNGPGGLVPDTTTGLDTPVYCVSVVTGDFDNDMDQDLYVVCRRGVDNLVNRIYENQGDGTFVEIFSHGAEGPVGVNTEVGLGESAVLADYDVDGFLDIYLTNGLLYYPINVGGPENLFRNLGNSNHWLEIDLEGTVSNRDGVGAKVYVTAGGVTQLREQNGGYHRWSQNHQRLHIGLGSNTTADVTIEWPSGETDTHTGVAADALYIATENGAIAPATLGPAVYTTLAPGDECGEPPYDFDYGPAVFAFKDCGTGLWSIRAKGGRVTAAQLYAAGQIVADAPFADVAGFALTAGDLLDNTAAEVIEFDVGAWYSNDKGFDFNASGATTACLTLTTNDFPRLIVGASGKTVEGGSLDLVTLTACEPPLPPPDLPECGEPTFDNNTENGMFLWRDCEFPSISDARWKFVLSGGGAPWGPYSAIIDSDAVLAPVPLDIEPNDTLDDLPGDSNIFFTLNVGGNGVDSFLLDVPLDSATCFDNSTLPDGTPVLVGEDKLPAPEMFDLLTGEACTTGCHP